MRAVNRPSPHPPDPLVDQTPPPPALAPLVPAPLRGWRDQFRAEHVGLVITLSYVFLATVGMLHEALVFAAFKVNIIAFAEPSDFILAAIRDPLIIVVTVAALPVVAVYFRWARRLHIRNTGTHRWYMGSPVWRQMVMRYFPTLFVSTVLIYAFAFSALYSLYTSNRLRAGVGRHVRVDLISDPARLASDTAAKLLLGTTQKFVFLYDPVAHTTTIVPSNNIARVVVDSRKKRDRVP